MSKDATVNSTGLAETLLAGTNKEGFNSKFTRRNFFLFLGGMGEDNIAQISLSHSPLKKRFHF